MPMPMPHADENDDDFMDRCMGDDMMNEDYPDSEQRAAVCRSQMDGKASASRVPARLRLCGGAAVTLQAAGDGDGQKLRGFSGVAYTGGQMRPAFFWEDVVVDLAGVKLAAGKRPILLSHDPARIVGHSESIEVGKNIAVAGVISGIGPAAQEVVATADNGFPWKMSIGADVLKMVRLEEGDTAEVNGRTVKGPLLIAKKSLLYEISFVPLGADDKTSAKVAASGDAAQTLEVIPMNLEKWLEAKGIADFEALPEAVQKTLRASFDAEQKPSDPPKPEEKPADPPPVKVEAEKPPVDPAAEYRKAIAAEAKRIAAVKKACGDGHPEILAQAIEENWDETKTSLHVELADLRAGRPKAPAGHVVDRGVNSKILEAAMCRSAGLPAAKIEKWFDEKTLEASSRFKRISIPQLLSETIRAAGMEVPANFDNDFIRAAFRASRKLEAEAAFSTVNLPGILGNTANKVLMTAYQAYPGVATLLSGTASAKDFKSFSSYMLTMTGEIQQVGASGELQHISFSEDSFSNQVLTRGAMVALTRTHIVNDDLEAFLQIPRMLGRKCAEGLEKQWFTTFMDSAGTFFTGARGNLNTSNALNVTNLGKAEKAFINQQDDDDKPIMVLPTMMLVPPTLKTAGDGLYVDEEIRESVTKPITADATGATSKYTTGNPFKGRFRPLVSPWLEVTSLTNYSTSTWYLLADPADVAAMQIAYLNGQQTPVIEQGDVDFNVLGVQWRCYFDFGIAGADFRAAQKNTA